MNSPIRIVIADDHALIRRGLKELLATEADCEVVAEVDDVATAARCVRGYQPAGRTLGG